MFERINQFFENRLRQAESAPDGFDHKHIAVAALLVEAARKDGHFDAAEQDAIVRLLKSHFTLPQPQAEALLAVAERRERLVMHNWIFYEHIRRGFADEERDAIIGDLWQLAFADKTLNRFEESLIETVAKEIGVSPERCQDERSRAKLRAGVER
jgi:uncharacterized tellurite resistance protein B-like protein